MRLPCLSSPALLNWITFCDIYHLPSESKPIYGLSSSGLRGPADAGRWADSIILITTSQEVCLWLTSGTKQSKGRDPL